jgi:hypothetical protein
MFKRMRTSGLAGTGAVLLVLSIAGFVAAASIAKVGVDPTVDPTPTTQGFVDVNDDGIADTCQPDVVVNAEVAAGAAALADLNGDGQISVSEAAQSWFIGGANCNHGGYVNGVAHACGAAVPVVAAVPAASAESSPTVAEVPAASPSSSPLTTIAAPTTECVPTEADQAPETTAPAVCVAPVAPLAPVAPSPSAVIDATLTTVPTVLTSPNDHGKKVSAVAHSTAIGGKNCNHGGAVSEAAHQDKAARDAAKAAKSAARDAAKAARTAAHQASKANSTHGKGHNR